MTLNVDIIAKLDERAAAMAATQMKNQMIRAGAVSGEAFTKALNEAANKYKFSVDRINSELEKQFTSHGQRAAQHFGTGFGGQLARSLPGVSGFTSAMAGYEGAAAKTGALAGRALGLAFTTAAGGLIGAAGYTLFKGFERYEAIDTAKSRLDNLNRTLQSTGKETINVAAVMETVNQVVLDTPFKLDQAFSVATRALASNTGDLKRFMTDVSDAAGFANAGIDDIGEAFLKIANQGKVSMEELSNELRNIPIQSWLAETMHVSGAQLTKMIHDNKVGLEDLLRAVEANAKGFAKASGETIHGQMEIMQATVARAGANFIGAIFGKPAEQGNELLGALKSVNDRLRDVDAWVKAHQNEIHDLFKNAAEAARDVSKAVGEIGKALADHKDLVKTATEGFLIWKGLKFTGLFAGLDGISNKLGSRGGGGIIGQLGVALLMFGELNRLNNGQHGPSDGPNFGSQGALAAGGAMLGWQLGGPWGAGAGALGGAAAAPIQDYLNPPGPSQTGALPGAPGIGTGPGGKREARTPQELYMYGPGFSVPNTPAPKPGGQQPAAQLPAMPPWTAPNGQTYTWDWAKGGYVPAGPGAPGPHGGPIQPPSGAAGGGQGQHLPKAPVVPYDTALPPGFSDLPMSSSLLSAESSFLDNRHKLAEKEARLAQLEKDGAATEQDVLEARNDVVTAGRDLQQAEMRLYEERASIFGKHTKQIKSWLSELGEIGASLDQDFGISKGLAGIAENITKFIANLAAAPLLGQLGASQIAAGYKPGEAGQGLMGALAAGGVFGSQYQLTPFGSFGQGSQGGAGGPYGGTVGPAGYASGGYPASVAGAIPGVGGGMPYGLPAGTNSGGYGGSGAQFPDWVYALGNAFDVKPSTYPGHQEGDRHEPGFAPNPGHQNRGIDWTGSVENMQRFAEYLASQPGMEQVIWQNPQTGQRIGVAGGRDVSGTGYYAGDYGDHQNHVHSRQSTSIPPPGLPGGLPGVASPSGFGTTTGGGFSAAPAGFGPGGAPLAPGGGGGSWWGGPGPGGPQPGGIGQGMPGLPNTSNPVRKGGVAPPQGKGSGGAALGGLAMGAISSAIGAAGMAGNAFAPGGGQAAAAVAQAMMQLVNRGIQFGSQAAGIGVQGLAETFLPAGSDLATNNWITKIAGGLAGATPNLPNLAGAGGEEGPTPEQVVGQGQGLDGRPAGLPDPAQAGNTDNSKNVTNNNTITINGASINNEQSMANTVAAQQTAMYQT